MPLHKRKEVAKLAAGAASVLLVFLAPVFLLRLCLLVGGLGAAGIAALRLSLGQERAKAAAQAIGIVVVTVGVSLVVGEYVVRAALSDVTTTGDGTSYFARRWRGQLEPPNALGYREHEVAPGPAEGVYRIAVIGDSFTEGQGIARSDRMTERLQEILDRSGEEFEVLNFGRAGQQTVEHVATLTDVVLPLQPNFVLMQWFVNDVEGDNESQRQRPVPHRLLPSETAVRWLHQHSALYYLIDQRWNTLQRSLGLVESYEAYMDRRFLDPDSPDMIEAQSELRKFISLARQNGVGVGIVLFPILDYLVDSKADFPLAYLMDRVMDVCRAEGVRCVDLRDAFVGVTEEDGWWVNRLDNHPGPRPNQIAADQVAHSFRDLWGLD
jgi:hypothetical protein